jgi:hypothetical protein
MAGMMMALWQVVGLAALAVLVALAAQGAFAAQGALTALTALTALAALAELAVRAVPCETDELAGVEADHPRPRLPRVAALWRTRDDRHPDA